MRTYTWRDKKKEQRKGLLVMVVGFALWLWCIYSGATSNNHALVAGGFALLCLDLMVAVLLFVRAERMFVWCYADTLEVNAGVAIRRHDEPFFYKAKELGKTQLLSLKTKLGPVVKTIRIPVGKVILRYRVKCAVEIYELQQFYNCFLRERDTCRTPQEIMEEALVAMFEHERDELRILCIGYQQEEPSTRAAYVKMVMDHKVQRFLAEVFVHYGLKPINIQCECSVDLYTIS